LDSGGLRRATWEEARVKKERCRACDDRDGVGAGQAGDKRSYDEASLLSRRELVAGTLAASSMITLGRGILDPAAAQPAESFPTIGEISRANGKLQAVIRVLDEKRLLPFGSSVNVDKKPQPAREGRMRYFEAKLSNGEIWPPPAAAGALRSPLPGPTLRAHIGDQVEITYLNHTSERFVESFDNAEKGKETGCDLVVGLFGRIYPDEAGDKFSNCFHGSSTTNLHFHGTHVTPDGLGDNVLLQLRPDPTITEDMVHDDFAKIFAAGPPTQWSDLPETWRNKQLDLLKAYDDNAEFGGRQGTKDNPALPREMQLRPQTDERIAQGLWPEYQIGAYPFCFKITERTVGADGKANVEMGQCPGTHWYHAHKHGSTALNVFHGMAGAFIIEGDYDEALRSFDARLKQNEKVLIVQQFSETQNLVSRRDHPSLFVNGRINPTIPMRPGEIQLWRLINATVKAVTTWRGFQSVEGAAPEVRQIAQDGVQFNFENYQSQPLLRLPAGAPPSNTFTPGSRMDILVKAPARPGPYVLQVEDTAWQTPRRPALRDLLTVMVDGPPISPAMSFPTKVNYPAFPDFLKDIPESDLRGDKRKRTLDFGWQGARAGPGFGIESFPGAPQFTIDGKQFSGQYDQTMVLGDVEEWTLTNSTARIAHPFHIHVNPFQVVEIYDPNSSSDTLYKPDKNFVWRDVVAIPPARLDSNGNMLLDATGNALDPGYVKIRHRFADFVGSYVLHCHMLAHEDRGMMQLVRVVRTPDEAKVVPALTPHH
jgi:FtsP/CotA-like multicopper oxidase with cupredoxin domain